MATYKKNQDGTLEKTVPSVITEIKSDDEVKRLIRQRETHQKMTDLYLERVKSVNIELDKIKATGIDVDAIEASIKP